MSMIETLEHSGEALSPAVREAIVALDARVDAVVAYRPTACRCCGRALADVPPAGELSRAGLRRAMGPVRMRCRRLLGAAAASADRRARAVGRDLLRLWPTLWTVLEVEGLEPTNNRAERALRSPVIRRKLSFGSQSGAGLRTTERLLSVTHTCRQRQRNLLSYLTETITAHRQGYTPPALLPAN